MLSNFKKTFYLLCLLLLSGCATSSTAFLGPIFTGAKTGSVYQASLSYGSGKIMRKLNNLEVFNEISLQNPKNNKKITELSYFNKNPNILLSYKVDQIVFSEIIEPEPLP